jgi:hypothetical protein
MQNAIPEWRRTARHYPGGPVSQPGEAAAGSGVRQVLEELGEELQAWNSRGLVLKYGLYSERYSTLASCLPQPCGLLPAKGSPTSILLRETDALVVRQLHPYHVNINKRQVKSPKIYIRDSGMLHQLLGIGTMENLLSHPKVGASWEGFVIEQVLTSEPHDEAFFWSTHQYWLPEPQCLIQGTLSESRGHSASHGVSEDLASRAPYTSMVVPSRATEILREVLPSMAFL